MFETTSERIVGLMGKKNMSQSDLAKKTGITKSSISRYIKGTREPKADKLVSIAAALDTTVSYLLGAELYISDKEKVLNEVEEMSEPELHDVLHFIEFMKWKRMKTI